MGVDFVSGKAKHFSKGWDREAVALSTPDLFKVQPTSETRLIQGELMDGAHVEVGDALVARLTDRGFFAYRRGVPVISFPSPPSEILDAVREGSGVAGITIESVGELSETVKVSLK